MVIVLVQLWLSLGVSFLHFSIGLQSVDKTYEDAIDGIRNRWQELWFVHTTFNERSIIIWCAVAQIISDMLYVLLFQCIRIFLPSSVTIRTIEPI